MHQSTVPYVIHPEREWMDITEQEFLYLHAMEILYLHFLMFYNNIEY